MNYNDFLTRQQQIKKLSIAEQKNFYEQLLKKKYDKTEVRILASFYYGQLFYQEGNFRKTIEIIEPPSHHFLLVYAKFLSSLLFFLNLAHR